MITSDEIITDSIGANYFLANFFDSEDLCNELAYQVLAERRFYKGDIFDDYKKFLEEDRKMASTGGW